MVPQERTFGVPPPQQARSRAALQKVLDAAEQVLVEEGADEFTMAAVATRAGVSVGGVYRRFAGKEQLLTAVKDRLLTRLEGDLATALAAPGDLGGVVGAFARTLAGSLSEGNRLLTILLGPGRSDESVERGGRAHEVVQGLFVEAALRHVDEVRRADPASALVVAERAITSSAVLRVVAAGRVTDGLTWRQWVEQLVDMTLLYLTSPELGRREP